MTETGFMLLLEEFLNLVEFLDVDQWEFQFRIIRDDLWFAQLRRRGGSCWLFFGFCGFVGAGEKNAQGEGKADTGIYFFQ